MTRCVSLWWHDIEQTSLSSATFSSWLLVKYYYSYSDTTSLTYRVVCAIFTLINYSKKRRNLARRVMPWSLAPNKKWKPVYAVYAIWLFVSKTKGLFVCRRWMGHQHHFIRATTILFSWIHQLLPSSQLVWPPTLPHWLATECDVTHCAVTRAEQANSNVWRRLHPTYCLIQQACKCNRMWT